MKHDKAFLMLECFVLDTFLVLHILESVCSFWMFKVSLRRADARCVYSSAKPSFVRSEKENQLLLEATFLGEFAVFRTKYVIKIIC